MCGGSAAGRRSAKGAPPSRAPSMAVLPAKFTAVTPASSNFQLEAQACRGVLWHSATPGVLSFFFFLTPPQEELKGKWSAVVSKWG